MSESNTTKDQKTIGSLETAFDIVELIANNEATTPTELSEQLGYSRSTIHYYLTTMKKHRFLLRGDDGYQIGFRFSHYGNRAIRDHERTGVMEEEVEKLARETNMTALFAIQQQGRCVFIYQSAAGRVDTGYYLGTEQYHHCTAFGKVLLAYLPEQMVDTILEQHGLPEVESGVVTEQKELIAELSTVREQGFAYQREGCPDQTSTIAAPVIQDREKEGVGAIGIVGDSEAIAPGSHLKAQRFTEKPATIVKRYAQILRNKLR